MSNSSIDVQDTSIETDTAESNVIVVTTANDENDGKDNGQGLSLREAVEIADRNQGADLILFEENLSGSTIELSLGELKIEDSVTIKNTTGENITIDANGNSRVINIHDGDANNKIDVTLEGLTIARGKATPDDRDGTGGGILNQESLTILGVKITDNNAERGGGIDNQGVLNVYNSYLENNGARNGGAISNSGEANISQTYISNNSLSAIANSGDLNLIYTEIYDNQGVIGGAIDNSGETNVIYSNIYNNSALSKGGAVINRDGKITFSQSNITNNSAGEDGGGIYNTSGELDLSYSLVSGNSAGENGAGIANDKAVANIDGSSITNNSTLYSAYTSAVQRGGGISITSSTLNLTDSDISNNEAIFGGGIYSESATVNIENSTVSKNYSDFVGGGTYHTQTDLYLTDSVITGNEASFAYGGVGLSESKGNIDESTISDNTALDTGGINISTSIGNITNSTVSGNTATQLDTGGIGVSNASANIENSTVSDNSAANNGGGINNAISSETSLSNSTVSRNSAANGGGIYQAETVVSYGGDSYGGSVDLNSTVVAGNVNNSDLGGEDNFNSDGNNLIGNADGFNNSLGEDNGDLFGTAADPLDPQLGELQNNGGATETQELLDGSPGIDSGNNDNNLSTDQRGDGFDRTVNGATDIGAVEIQITGIDPNAILAGGDGIRDRCLDEHSLAPDGVLKHTATHNAGSHRFIFGDSATITNFLQGEDTIVFGNEFRFNNLDTNASGVLGDEDELIDIKDNSTIITLDSNTVTVEGITDLKVDDFIFGATS